MFVEPGTVFFFRFGAPTPKERMARADFPRRRAATRAVACRVHAAEAVSSAALEARVPNKLSALTLPPASAALSPHAPGYAGTLYTADDEALS